MPRKIIKSFISERKRLNEIVLKNSGRTLKRFYSIDSEAYKPGALDRKTKELMGLVASLVLRCDDCIKYHLINCHDAGVTMKEFGEAMAVGLVVGGSITIPHIRRAHEAWAELENSNKSKV